jgi:hypothetical protein
MSGSQQLAAKRDILIDALRRVGKIQLEASPIRLIAGETSNYASGQLPSPVWRELSWGFYKMGSHEVCAMRLV